MTILITGANRGIGLALAETYATSAPVIGTHRGPAPSGKNKIEWQELVVDDAQSHLNLANRLKDRPINALVCNAGVYLEKDHDYGADIWAKTFAVNVTGVFLTIEALMPNLRAAKGKIAIITSAMGSDKRAPGGSYIYRASKAAVLNLGRNLASDLRGEKIPVGIYHPGWVRTDMGGSEADIDTQQSADGLIKRISALSIATTGCFEAYDGTQLPF
jgi:NAD(P)-dependent dehydrogenase (short-subunit alcohol dehydrogenase family)